MRSFDPFVRFTLEWLRSTGTKFDQVIIETSGAKKWLHIGYKNGIGQQRGQILNIKV